MRGYTAEQLGVGTCSRAARLPEAQAEVLFEVSLHRCTPSARVLARPAGRHPPEFLASFMCPAAVEGIRCRADTKRGPANVSAFNGLGAGRRACLAPRRETVSRWDSPATGKCAKPLAQIKCAHTRIPSRALASCLAFLRWREFSKRTIEKQVIHDFQCSGDEEWNIDQGWPGKKKSCKQGTDGRAGRARDSRNSSGR